MTKAEYQKKLAELEREADRCGCCVIPAEPLIDPDDAMPSRKAVSRRSRSPDNRLRQGYGGQAAGPTQKI